MKDEQKLWTDNLPKKKKKGGGAPQRAHPLVYKNHA